jgi:hypothetical protein
MGFRSVAAKLSSHGKIMARPHNQTTHKVNFPNKGL